MQKFTSMIGDSDGSLTYAITGNEGTWSITRTSADVSDQTSSQIVSGGHATEDDAKQALYNMNVRNDMVIDNARTKLSQHEREQQALNDVLKGWTPPESE